MRKAILDALKAKFVGVGESVMNRIVDKLCKTVTTAEQVQTAVDGVTIQQVIEGYADSRATEASKTAIRTYEQKYGLKDGVKIEQSSGGVPPQKQGAAVQTSQEGVEAVPTWAQALIDSNNTLRDEIARMKTDRTTTQRKQQLSEVISKLPENLRKAYERTPVDGLTDEDFTTLLGEVTSEVSGIVQETKQKGAVFGRPSATGGSGSQGGELTKEQQEAIAHRDNKPASGGQPF